jgi:hypothetical protein
VLHYKNNGNSQTKKEVNLMRKITIFGVIIALLAFGGTALALMENGNTTYTGCLNPGGNIHSVAIGDEPARPCVDDQLQISWNSEGPQGPPGVSEAWATDKCMSYGCEEPDILTPDSGWKNIWFMDLPEGSYVLNVSIFAHPPVIFDDENYPIGRGPGGSLDCAFFSQKDDEYTDLTGIKTPGFGNGITDRKSTALTHGLELDSDTRFVLRCQFDPDSVNQELEDQKIQILGASGTAIKVDQLHRPIDNHNE